MRKPGWIPTERPKLHERVIVLVPTLGTTVAALCAGALFWPRQTGWVLAATGISTIAAGKFVVLGGFHPDSPLNAWELAVLVVWMDLVTGLIWVYNLDLIVKLPWLGRRFRALRVRSYRRLRSKPWLGRQAFLGVMLFVLFPLAGTGAIGAAILGHLLGMRKLINSLAIVVGSMLGVGGLTVLGGLIGAARARELATGSTSSWLMGTAIAVLLIILAYRLRRLGYSSRPSFWENRTCH